MKQSNKNSSNMYKGTVFFNKEVLTLSEKLTEEEITIWNQICCLPGLTNRLRERASPRDSERNIE